MSQFMKVVRDCCNDLYSSSAFLYEQSTVIFLEEMLSYLATVKVLAVDNSLTKVFIILFVRNTTKIQGIEKVELRTPDLTTYESPIPLENIPESSV